MGSLFHPFSFDQRALHSCPLARRGLFQSPIPSPSLISYLVSRFRRLFLTFLAVSPPLLQSPNSNATKCKSTELAGLEEGGCGLREV